MLIDATQSFPGIPGMLVGCATPSLPAGVPNASSIGIDLNSDFGRGPAEAAPYATRSLRKSPLLEQSGEDIVVVCKVIEGFVDGAGTPVIQFHAAVSNAAPGGFLTSGGSSYIFIGSNCGHQAIGGGTRLLPGYRAADLPINSTFFIRLNPYSSVAGKTAAAAVLSRRDLRSFGVIASIVNYDMNTNNTVFSAGAIQCYLAKSADIWTTPTDFIPPAGYANVS